jgi:hypothetical protein
MLSSFWGLVCLVFAGFVGGLALLMTFGVLLEYSRAGALYAGLLWLPAVALLILGLRLRQRRV